MTLQDVIDNLDCTITGKELLLKSYEDSRKTKLDSYAEMVCLASIAFIQLNIDELTRIKDDLNKVACEHMDTRI